VRRGGDDDLAELRPLYDRRAAQTNGNLDRNDWAWRRALRGWDDTAVTFAVDGDSGPEGYIAFTRPPVSPSAGRFDIRVRDLVASTPAAARRLLALVCDHSSLGRDLVWTGPPGDPLHLHVREQNADVEGGGGCDWVMRWMVRVIDVRKALAARGYSPAVRARVDFEVRDDLLPANNARFVLEVEDGEVRVRKGGRGTLRIDVRGLAALYTGFLSPHQLAAGGLAEGKPAALASAAAVFAGPSPWLVEIF